MMAPRSHRRKSGGGVKVKGIDDVLVRLARCCTPVPGDKIIGFVTRGRGVSVHRIDCPNASELLSAPERIIDVEWDLGTNTTFQVEIFVEALDRLRLLQDVTAALAESGVNILASSTTTHRDGLVDMRFLFELGDLTRLDTVLREVRGTEGVFEARRMMSGEATQRKRGRPLMQVDAARSRPARDQLLDRLRRVRRSGHRHRPGGRPRSYRDRARGPQCGGGGPDPRALRPPGCGGGASLGDRRAAARAHRRCRVDHHSDWQRGSGLGLSM